MPVDWSKVDELTLALLHLTSFQQGNVTRSWKGHDWEVLNRLREKGWISDPATGARSVVLTDDGKKRARALFERNFGPGNAVQPPAGGACECGCLGATAGGAFLPGHDQKLRISLEARVGGLLTLRRLVEAAESYASGEATTEELGQTVRCALWQKE